MDNSWVKLHRKFIESPIWKYSIQAHMPHLISLWIYLLLSVNWEEKKWYDGNEEIIIPAGSLVTSIKHLSEYMKITSMQVRTSLDHYEKMKMITRKTTNKWTQVWIVNWAKYQGGTDKDNILDNKPITNEQQTDNKPITTTKEYKNIRNKEYNIGTAQKISYRGSPRQLFDREDVPVTLTGTNGIHTKWQEKAFRYAASLSIDLTPDFKGRWLKIFKDADMKGNSQNIEKAYTYLADYPEALDNEGKIKMFFKVAGGKYVSN